MDSALKKPNAYMGQVFKLGWGVIPHPSIRFAQPELFRTDEVHSSPMRIDLLLVAAGPSELLLWSVVSGVKC